MTNPRSLLALSAAAVKQANFTLDTVPKTVERYVTNMRKCCTIDSVVDAAKHGHVACLKRAHLNGCLMDEEVTFEAAINGRLSCLKYAYDNGVKFDVDIGYFVALEGHLHILKYICDNGYDLSVVNTLDGAIEGDHFECFKYAFENGCEYDSAMIEIVIENDQLEFLKYAHETGWLVTEDMEFTAARHGRLEILRYFHLCGYKIEFDVALVAARYNHFECFDFVVENMVWSVPR
jgi:hypothetical protein